MNEIINLHFEDAPCRTVVIDGARWWVGKDVCAILGYKDTVNALKLHCKGVLKYHPISDRLGREQDARIISLPDVYRLISGSKLPAAVRFEAWIYEDVLPSIHKTGGYAIEKTESLEELHDLLKRSERSLKFLTTERAYLSRENRLLRENIKLRDKLAKKNTPLTADEKAQIHALSDRMSASAIGSVLGRSESAVRRVLKQESNE